MKKFQAIFSILQFTKPLHAHWIHFLPIKVLSGQKIAGQVVISIMSMRQVVILNFILVTKRGAPGVH